MAGRVDLDKLTIIEFESMIKKGFDGKVILKEMQELALKNKNLNIFISEFFQEAIDNFSEKKFIPLAVKDCFHIKGKVSTAGSRMLKNMVAPFNATIIERLKECLPVGKTSMDEFAMGSSGKTCAYGITYSPWKNKNGERMSPGGSSSGSCAAVSLGCALAALGTDTGGSIRQPAAWSGLVGLKPTYGVVSRYGMIELASSLDCPGLITKTVQDAEFLFSKIIGFDENDPNTTEYKPEKSLKKVAYFVDDQASVEIIDKIYQINEVLKSKGYEIFPCKIDLLDYTIPVYQLICSSEASSNLSRFNGLLYGDGGQYEDPFVDARSKLFGDEVKRRIVAGNYCMYFGNKEGFYKKAKQILTIIYNNVSEILKEADAIIMPCIGGPGMTVEETLNPDPIRMYLCDYYTGFANLLGIPAMNIPVGLFRETETPIGVQVVSKHFGENLLFEIGKVIDSHFNFAKEFNWRRNDSF